MPLTSAYPASLRLSCVVARWLSARCLAPATPSPREARMTGGSICGGRGRGRGRVGSRGETAAAWAGRRAGARALLKASVLSLHQQHAVIKRFKQGNRATG